ncbi:MAG: hypothetical protein HYX90_07950 [Chloroflexi bacterium]|nr:hypothetical protein [Chloroflexota bacterium]
MPLLQGGNLDDKGAVIRAPIASDIMTGGELYQRVYGKPPAGKAWEAYRMVIALGAAYDYVIHLPPGTPQDIVATYWEACSKMAKDAAFLEAIAPLVGESPQVVAGETCDREFQANLGASVVPEVVNWFKEVMTTKYNLVTE